METSTNTNKNILIISAILLLVILVVGAIGFFFIPKASDINLATNKSIISNSSLASINGIKLDFESLELAQTSGERQMGYMNRDKICGSCGMLFIFEQTQPLSFWMKNTLVPLNIIFIDEKGVVINSGVGQPQVTSPSVSAFRPGKYVLEVPLDSKVKLNSGDVVDIEYLKSRGKPHSTIGKQLKE
jgi:uncharacterized membrane protein (UPF0127 family)